MHDVNNSSVALGQISSTTTSFSLKINTKGEQDEEVTYGFAAEVYDNKNNMVTTEEQLPNANSNCHRNKWSK